MSQRPGTTASVSIAQDLSDVRVGLERLQALLATHSHQFTDLETRSPPLSAAGIAARRMKALLGPFRRSL
jgi:hypothetical protein